MKTVIIDMDGKFPTGTYFAVQHKSPGGGCNTAKYTAPDDMTGPQVALVFAGLINGGASEFNAGSFQADASDSQLTVMCDERAGDVNLEAFYELPYSTGAVKFPVEVL